MKRSTAIVAAIVVVAVIVVAAVGVMLLGPQWGLDGGQGSGAADGRPIGPMGTVNGAVVNIGMNESNASAFDDLMEEFNETSNATSEPDVLCQIAVTNNKTDDMELNAANFTASLDDGGSVPSLNTNVITVESNTTVYLVLGFQTDGGSVSSISYDDGDVDLDMPVRVPSKDLGPVTMVEAPENLTSIDDLTFESPVSWTIANGSMSPMPLYFNGGEKLILVMVIGTNNGTDDANLKATDFWLDVGNGTWVQAESDRNHNVVSTIGADTTKAFLVGFRVNETASPTEMQYWPDQGTNATVSVEIDPEKPSEGTSPIWLYKVWDDQNDQASDRLDLIGQVNQTGEGNQTGADDSGYRLYVALNESSDAPSGDVNLRGWSEKNGLIEAKTVESNRTNGTAYIFELERGDDITLLQYEAGGETRYLWLRPLVLL